MGGSLNRSSREKKTAYFFSFEIKPEKFFNPAINKKKTLEKPLKC